MKAGTYTYDKLRTDYEAMRAQRDALLAALDAVMRKCVLIPREWGTLGVAEAMCAVDAARALARGTDA